MKYVAVVLMFLVAIAGAETPRAQSTGTILERVVVRVNGEILTQTELTQRQTDAIRQRNEDTQNLPDEALMALVYEVTPDVLVNTIDELLIAQRGREIGAVFSEEEFATVLASLREDNNLDEDEFEEALAQEGLTMQALRANFERAYMIQTVQSEEIFRRMTITEEELRQFFNGHRETFLTPETVTLRELAVSAPTRAAPVAGQAAVVRAEDVAAARTRIEGIRARALGGEDFAALVAALSESPTRANGGLIGPLNLEDINEVVRAAIEDLGPGSISEPVELARGSFQIFQVEARDVAALPPFSTMRDRIEQEVRNERLTGEMEKLLARLRAQAVIEWKDDSLRKIYVTRMSENATP